MELLLLLPNYSGLIRWRVMMKLSYCHVADGNLEDEKREEKKGKFGIV
jgi:hypothetical protein